MTVETWNATFPPGTPVDYYPTRGFGDVRKSKTRSKAWALGHGAIVVQIEDQSGGVSIEHLAARRGSRVWIGSAAHESQDKPKLRREPTESKTVLGEIVLSTAEQWDRPDYKATVRLVRPNSNTRLLGYVSEEAARRSWEADLVGLVAFADRLGLPVRPTIVCLCGSTKFKEAYQEATLRETLAGKIVLSVGCFMHADGVPITDEQKAALDELHLRKIDLADEVLILNVGGYFGESTRRELKYAEKQKKKIRYLEV
jgi:hypothetical protein